MRTSLMFRNSRDASHTAIPTSLLPLTLTTRSNFGLILPRNSAIQYLNQKVSA